MTTNISGEIIAVLTQKENDWGRYKIALTGNKDIIAVGVIAGAAVGMTVSLTGEEIVNQYGRQFKVASVSKAYADKYAGIRQFLSGGFLKYCGTTTASNIIRMFGEKSLDMFETAEGQKALLSVKGIGKKTLAKMILSFNENKKYKEILLFLNGAGTRYQVEKIYETYGKDTVKVLRENPYRLQIDLDGFGFVKIDRIAVSSGVKPTSVYRMMAAVKFVIENAQKTNGHCYLTLEEIKKEVVPLLAAVPTFPDISNKVAENALAKEDWREARETLIKEHNPSAETITTLTQIAETRKLILDELSDAILQAVDEKVLINEDGCIYTASMHQCEVSAARTLSKMCKDNPVRFIPKDKIEESIKEVEKRKTEELEAMGRHEKFVISPEQRNAAFLGLLHRVSIISGGPGRGKTSIIEVILHAFINAGKRKSPDDILILAPTGRAAQRVTESTGFPSSTIHRAIYEFTKTDGKVICHLTRSIPEGKLIICDESSMVDIRLANDLFLYARKSNLILVGDVDQIASVGPGKVLKDLIDTGIVPCAMLKEGHRNAGSIAHNADLINAGQKIANYCYDDQFIYFPSTAEHIADDIAKDYVAMVKKYGIKNVMLCTAMRERGCAAVNKLNLRLQQLYTTGQPEAKFSAKVFRVGDRVMQVVNNYNFELRSPDGSTRQGIFNGERGSVVRVLPDEENESYKIVVLFDDGSLGGYTRETVDNLTLAYATTLHKCQGSEAECMIMAYTYGDYMLLNKSLFYTGETRAKQEFHFHGEEQWKYGKMLSAFDLAVTKTEGTRRNTKLTERVQQLVNG